jgi:hypothetical protein
LVILTASLVGAVSGYKLSPDVFRINMMGDGPPGAPTVQVIALLPGCIMFPAVAVPLGIMGVSLDRLIHADIFALANAIAYGLASYSGFQFKKRLVANAELKRWVQNQAEK